MNFYKKYNSVICEIRCVLDNIDSQEIEKFIELFKKNTDINNIVVAGAGRMGYAGRGFAMRLGHLGFRAWAIGDTTVPMIQEKDLLVILSGSGNTQTIYDIAHTASINGAQIALITNNPDSRIGKLATKIIKISNFHNEEAGIKRSVQPMTTLNEQVTTLLLDSIVLAIMENTGETHETMWSRHSNLE